MNFTKIMESIFNCLKENKQLLNDLDQAIGDGDHGTNVVRGFEGVIERQNMYVDKTINENLKSIAMTLMSKIGGSSGPLLGTLCLQMSMNLKEETIQGYAEAFEFGLNGIKNMGKSDVGDKTMIDSLFPAIESLKLNADKDEKKAFELATMAAKKGMESTKNMIAKKGRASYLGERSKGHVDPGSYSIYLIFKAIGEAL